jgi:hypothetical protein
MIVMTKKRVHHILKHHVLFVQARQVHPQTHVQLVAPVLVRAQLAAVHVQLVAPVLVRAQLAAVHVQLVTLARVPAQLEVDHVQHVVPPHLALVHAQLVVLEQNLPAFAQHVHVNLMERHPVLYALQAVQKAIVLLVLVLLMEKQHAMFVPIKVQHLAQHL